MQPLGKGCSCVLLVLAAFINVAVASGGGKVPIYPRVCVGDCCETRANIDFKTICSKQLEIFPGGVDLDSPEAALVGISLASSITNVALITDPKKQAAAACTLRNYLSQIGADFRSVKFYFFDGAVDISTAPDEDITFTGGAVLFAAGPNVWTVFSGVNRGGTGPPESGFPNFPIDFTVDGTSIGKTNDLWLSYYNQAFRQPDNDIIADALEYLSADWLPPTKQDQGINFSDRKLYIAGYSAGGIASIYASFDLLEVGQQTAAHIYLFGNPKPGDTDFVDYYFKSYNGLSTSAWWNQYDITPALPPKTKDEQAQLRSKLKTTGDKKELDGWGFVPEYVKLPGELYWRIVPGKNGGQCVKVKDSDDVLYAACPDDPKKFTCGLNFEDHNNEKYQDNIKACVVPTPNTKIRRRRYAFNPTCIGDVTFP